MLQLRWRRGYKIAEKKMILFNISYMLYWYIIRCAFSVDNERSLLKSCSQHSTFTFLMLTTKHLLRTATPQPCIPQLKLNFSILPLFCAVVFSLFSYLFKLLYSSPIDIHVNIRLFAIIHVFKQLQYIKARKAIHVSM